MAELEDILSSPLSKLDEVFKRMLEKVEVELRPGGTTILRIAISVVRPLTVVEFRYALAMGSGDHNFEKEAAMPACRDFPGNDQDSMK